MWFYYNHAQEISREQQKLIHKAFSWVDLQLTIATVLVESLFNVVNYNRKNIPFEWYHSSKYFAHTLNPPYETWFPKLLLLLKMWLFNIEGNRKMGCDNEATAIAQQVVSEVVGKNWLVYWKWWAFPGSQSLFLIRIRIFYGLNFTRARPYPSLITTFNQALFYPE